MPTLRKGPHMLAGPVTLAVLLYAGLLLTWLVLKLSCGDRWWWLFLLNAGAPYLFLPLPLVLLAALALRTPGLWVGLGAAAALGGALYGGLFLPAWPQPPAPGPALVAMTYNVLAFNGRRQEIVATLRDSGADLVALQELTAPLADLIERDLADLYPYRVVDLQHGPRGMGVLSRYPLRDAGETLPGQWLGRPQVLTLDLAGTQVTVVNVHNVSVFVASSDLLSNLGSPVWRSRLEQSARVREDQARVLADFAARHPGPLLVLGDLNTAEQSRAYRIISGALEDAWRGGGSGLGHTFPGTGAAGGTRLTVAGVSVPMWLARIDYIFHSRAWRTRSAWLGPPTGASDHRPVLAELALVGP